MNILEPKTLVQVRQKMQPFKTMGFNSLLGIGVLWWEQVFLMITGTAAPLAGTCPCGNRL